MRLLSFIAKVAFMCNLFFVLCMIMRYTGIGVSQGVEGFVIIVGWILSVFFNLLFAAGFITALVRRKRAAGIHWVLSVFNLLCLPFQIIFIFVLSR